MRVDVGWKLRDGKIRKLNAVAIFFRDTHTHASRIRRCVSRIRACMSIPPPYIFKCNVRVRVTHEYHPQGLPLIVTRLSSSFERARAARSPICHPPICENDRNLPRASLSTAIFNSAFSQRAKNNIRLQRKKKNSIRIWIRSFFSAQLV